MKIPKELFVLFVIFFIQQLPNVADWGVDLPLIFVVLAGLRKDLPQASAWGFLTGLIQDLLSVGGIGVNTISKTLAALGASFLKTHIYREKVTTQTFLIFCLSIFHELFSYLLLRWNGSAPRVEDALGICSRSVLLTTITGSVICFFLVRLRRSRQDPATA
jgi:rod shape-determining protein MreD